MARHPRQYLVGTAAWTIPKLARDLFFPAGAVKPNHLDAYAARFRAVEINSSFYREHQGKTYQRWAQATPGEFRFSVKLAKRFTHIQKLKVDTSDLQAVLTGIFELREKLGVILVQLPPKLAFDEAVAEDFFAAFRELYDGAIALEPRHASWVSREATSVLEEHRIARVVADPDRLPAAPAIRSAEFNYFRLHGSPEIYYSDYNTTTLNRWARIIAEAGKKQSWCIFDNTALGHATLNALHMQQLLTEGASASPLALAAVATMIR